MCYLKMIKSIIHVPVIIVFLFTIASSTSALEITNVGISPKNPFTYNDIKCYAFVSDNVPIISLEAEWFVNNVSAKKVGYNTKSKILFISSTLESSKTSAGDRVSCCVSAYNEEGDYLRRCEEVRISEKEESEPKIVVILSRNPRTIRCLVGAWDENAHLKTLDVSWYVDGGEVKKKSMNISGTYYSYMSDLERGYLSSDYSEVECRAKVCNFEKCVGGNDVMFASSENRKPVAIINASERTLNVGEIVYFDMRDSWDEDGYVSSFYVDFGDGGSTKWINDPVVFYSYKRPGSYLVSAKVKDNEGMESDEAYLNINVVESSEGNEGFSQKRCSVSITGTNYFIENNVLYVEVGVLNDGESDYMLNLNAYSDSILKDFYNTYLHAGEEKEITLKLYVTPGRHDINVSALTPCKAQDSRKFPVKAYVSSVRKVKPLEWKKEVNASARIIEDNVTMSELESRVIKVELRAEDENVSIEVEGIPENWVAYNRHVHVRGKEDTYIYIFPQRQGEYSLNITVRAGNRVLAEKSVSLFVAKGEEKENYCGLTCLLKKLFSFLAYIGMRVLMP